MIKNCTDFSEEFSEHNSTDTDLVDTISEYLSQKKEESPEPQIIENKATPQEEVEVLKEISEHFNDLQAIPKKAEEESLKTPPPSPAEVTNNGEQHFEKCDISKGNNDYLFIFYFIITSHLFQKFIESCFASKFYVFLSLYHKNGLNASFFRLVVTNKMHLF